MYKHIFRRQTKNLKIGFNSVLILPVYTLYFVFRGCRYAFDQFVLSYMAVTVSSHYVQIWKEKSFKSYQKSFSIVFEFWESYY